MLLKLFTSSGCVLLFIVIMIYFPLLELSTITELGLCSGGTGTETGKGSRKSSSVLIF